MNKFKESTMSKHLTQMLLALFILGGASIGVAGCEQDGPAENIGESIDEGVEETQDEIDDNT